MLPLCVELVDSVAELVVESIIDDDDAVKLVVVAAVVVVVELPPPPRSELTPDTRPTPPADELADGDDETEVEAKDVDDAAVVIEARLDEVDCDRPDVDEAIELLSELVDEDTEVLGKVVGVTDED